MSGDLGDREVQSLLKCRAYCGLTEVQSLLRQESNSVSPLRFLISLSSQMEFNLSLTGPSVSAP